MVSENVALQTAGATLFFNHPNVKQKEVAMNSVSILAKDAGFSNNLRSLVELVKFAVQQVIAAHALKPVRNDAAEMQDAAYFDGVTDHFEMEVRLRQLDHSHLHAVWKLQSQI
ncbi:hypothetical protein [Herbaspirillum frisingense]|uniref:hypothetical protein n=1 Tax=Herbaspirillum frisingense TaxID=92645 RepID=UPI001F1EE078|nr:hypothetical protein [Herbaspirillum frisingense]UIN19967.1 hypothetical protein LAZ82_15925 [Herbaspirillum frisingense]